MIFEIPLSTGIPAFSQRTQLDGRSYLLSFAWNEREGSWYLDVADEHDAPIASSVKIVLNWPLLRRVVDARRLPGQLMAVDASGDDTSPALGDLGGRVRLMYLDAAEVAALGESASNG